MRYEKNVRTQPLTERMIKINRLSYKKYFSHKKYPVYFIKKQTQYGNEVPRLYTSYFKIK